MVSTNSQFAIAPEPVDELTRASAELAQYMEDLANEIAPEPEPLLFYTIRQLKAKVKELHLDFGALITKAAFGHRASDMTKFLLSKALTKVQGVLDKTPRTLRWTQVQESRRIVTSRADGQVWVTFFVFKTEQEAYKFYLSMLKPSRCKMAVVNRSDRDDCDHYPWLVRVWGINPEVLVKLVRKDTPLANLEDRVQAIAPKQPIIDEQDLPKGCSIQRTEDYLSREYYVFVHVRIARNDVPTPTIKAIGRLLEGVSSIEAYRQQAGVCREFTRTLDAIKYLVSGSGYSLKEIALAFDAWDQLASAF